MVGTPERCQSRSMSGPCQNEVTSFNHRDMQKGFYDPTPPPHYQGYYPASNGYMYDSNGCYAVPQLDGYPPAYGSQGGGAVLVQTGVGCPQPDYGQHPCVNGSFMQPADPHAQQLCHSASPDGIPTSPGLKQPLEIFPWMKESRQNTKQRLQPTIEPPIEPEMTASSPGMCAVDVVFPFGIL